MKAKLAQFLRFAWVSLLATTVDFGAGFALTQAGLTGIVVATGLGSIAGIVVGFILNKFWVFKDKASGGTSGQFGRYILVSLGNTVLNTAGVWALIGLGLTDYWLIRVLVGTTVFGFYSYVLTRAFVFSHPKSFPAPYS